MSTVCCFDTAEGASLWPGTTHLKSVRVSITWELVLSFI